MTPASIPPSPSRPNEKELRKRDVKATLDYLKSDRGRWLRDLHTDADKLEPQITDAALKEGCRTLRLDLDKKFDAIYERLQKSELYDTKLLRIQVEQVDAIMSVLDACADGEKEEARSYARDAAALNKEIEERITELERER